MNSVFWTLSWVFMIGGIVLIIAGEISRAYEEEKISYKGKTTATVVEIVAGSPDERGVSLGIHDYFYPVFVYYADGHLYKEICYEGGSNPCPFSLNQKLDIRYNTKDPTEIRISRKTKADRVYFILHNAGLLGCITGGVVFLLYAMRIFSKTS